MAIIKTDAVILRVVDFSESSLIATALAPSEGRVALMAKGARRSHRHRKIQRFDALNRVRLVYYEKRGEALDTLAECEVIETYPGLRTELSRWHAGWCVAELGRLGGRPKNADAGLYSVVCRALGELSAPAPAPTGVCLVDFLAGYLRALGLAPALSVCAATDKPLSAFSSVIVVPDEGKAYGDRAPAGARGIELTPIQWRVLERFLTGVKKPLRGVSLPASIANPVAAALMDLVTQALERRPRSFAGLRW